MAHFAKLDDRNLVLEVNVVNNETLGDLPFPASEPVGIEFLTVWSGGHSAWRQTSYNATFRKNYAGVGYTYDPDIDAFVAPQPYASWILDPETAQWQAPIPYPTDGQRYAWNETTQTWDLLGV